MDDDLFGILGLIIGLLILGVSLAAFCGVLVYRIAWLLPLERWMGYLFGVS